MNTIREKLLKNMLLVWLFWPAGAALSLMILGSYTKLELGGIVGIYSAIMLCSGLHFQFLAIRALDKQSEFVSLFASHFVSLDIVSAKLVARAKDFYEAEIEYAEACSIMSRKVAGNPEDEDRLASLHLKCELKKEAFWEAHNLAKSLGYPVQPKYKNYLAPPFVLGSSESVK